MPTNVEYERDGRPYVFFGGLTNKSGRRYSEDPDWAVAEPGVIYDACNRGLERTILRQPVGPGSPGWVLFTSWHPLTSAQKVEFEEGVGKWKGEDYRRKVGVFFGRDCTNPFVRRDHNIPEGRRIAADPNDEEAMRWWDQNIAPLRNIGVDEVWLDRGSANDSQETRKAIIHMARRERLLYGVKVGIEAVPHSFNRDGVNDRRLPPDWDYIAKCPAMGRWRYLWHNWIKQGNYDLLAVPSYYRRPGNQIEVHVNMVPTDNPPPTTGDAEWLSDHGWTISWKNRVAELTVGPRTEAPGVPPTPPPDPPDVPDDPPPPVRDPDKPDIG